MRSFVAGLQAHVQRRVTGRPARRTIVVHQALHANVRRSVAQRSRTAAVGAAVHVRSTSHAHHRGGVAIGCLRAALHIAGACADAHVVVAGQRGVAAVRAGEALDAGARGRAIALTTALAVGRAGDTRLCRHVAVGRRSAAVLVSETAHACIRGGAAIARAAISVAYTLHANPGRPTAIGGRRGALAAVHTRGRRIHAAARRAAAGAAAGGAAR
jgi:hypothetical protein